MELQDIYFFRGYLSSGFTWEFKASHHSVLGFHVIQKFPEGGAFNDLEVKGGLRGGLPSKSFKSSFIRLMKRGLSLFFMDS